LRIRIGNGLLPLNLLVWLLIVAIIFLPLNVLRIILGLPFILFFPGYALAAALFPKKEGIGSIERLTLSLAMSFVTVSLIGLILNYTPWGIRLEPMLYSIASFIFITSVIAWFRRRRLLWRERFGIEFHLVLPSWRIGIGDKVLAIILVLAILGALGVIGHVIATPKAEDKFTDFYILGLEEQAADYPRELRVGEEGRVIVGIANHEYETVSYRIEVRVNGTRNNEVGPIMLEHNGKWEEIVSFSLSEPREDQKVEFFLYKNGEVEPYLKPLHLWVDVAQ